MAPARRFPPASAEASGSGRGQHSTVALMESGSVRWGAREALYGRGDGEQDSHAMGAGSPIAVSTLLEIGTEPRQTSAASRAVYLAI